MPIVSVLPETFFKLLGVEPMEQEAVRELLLRYGLELDDVVTDEHGVTTYRIDVPANRPDLLCAESIALALKVFNGGPHPEYKLVPPTIEFKYEESVAKVRPVLVSAVLRDVTFTQESYQSFIDLQEKLHQNLCRRRKLASIGTHDLDKCKPPFVYRAEKPEDIVFVPLTGGDEVNGRQLFDNLRSHQQLKKYLELIEEEPLWPVIRDSTGSVCSLPPIINSDKTKIDLNTKNVFVECTALDLTRAKNAVIVICAAFSMYSKTPFTIEQVNIVRESGVEVTPKLEMPEFFVDEEYVRRVCGLDDLTADKIIELLGRMLVKAEKAGEGKLKVTCPATRTDILHQCDIAEDVAIALGYDNIYKITSKTIPSGRALGLNELSDRIRREVVGCLWTEVLTFSLCSTKECYDKLGLPDDGKAVHLMNSKNSEMFDIVRTTLLPGLMKCVRRILDQPNLKKPLPLRLFEVSDVCMVDETMENNARNERRICAIIADTKSRFDEVHGLLDRFFTINGAPRGYKLVGEDSPTFIPGQRAKVIYRDQEIGYIGVIHPKVLLNFDLTTPVVAFELKVEPFLAKH